MQNIILLCTRNIYCKIYCSSEILLLCKDNKNICPLPSLVTFLSLKEKEMTDKKVKDIKNIDELASFLKEKGENHKNYNHYTTSWSLNLILKNSTLRFTRGNSKNLNDWHEWNEKGKQDIWNKTYIACFSYGDFEKMAMWGLYCLPSKEAVRLTIPQKALSFVKKFNSNNSGIKIYKDEDKKELIGNEAIKSIILSDVFYFKDNRPQSHNGAIFTFSENHVVNLLDKENATGIIKNHSWSYEKEVRIIIRFKDEQYSSKNEYEILNNVYLEFPNEMIKNALVTKGPNFDEYINNNENLIRTIENINNETSANMKLEKSSYKGLIHFKSDTMIFLKKESKGC